MAEMIKYPLAYNPILEYWEEIEKGNINAGDKIRRTYKKVVKDIKYPGEYFYSPKRGNHILEFAENFCRHSKGKRVKLELWEKAHLATVFGFIDIEGNRKYRESILIVGKKNGKSLLASIVGLYMLTADGEMGPEVYAVATKKDQSKIIWLESKRMVRKSFKEVMKDDVNNTFMNVDEFADTHTVDGKKIPVLVDDNEIIEREKKMKSNMDGVYVKQKLIYVKADDFGPLPAIGRQIVFDGKRYMVTDSTDEGGVYTITMEANRTK